MRIRYGCNSREDGKGMNAQKEKAKAEKFNKKGMAYIHAEYKGNGDNQMMIAGDGIALLAAASHLLSRIGELSGEGFHNTLMEVAEMYELYQKEGAPTEVIIQGEKVPYPEDLQ